MFVINIILGMKIFNIYAWSAAGSDQKGHGSEKHARRVTAA